MDNDELKKTDGSMLFVLFEKLKWIMDSVWQRIRTPGKFLTSEQSQTSAFDMLFSESTIRKTANISNSGGAEKQFLSENKTFISPSLYEQAMRQTLPHRDLSWSIPDNAFASDRDLAPQQTWSRITDPYRNPDVRSWEQADFSEHLDEKMKESVKILNSIHACCENLKQIITEDMNI